MTVSQAEKEVEKAFLPDEVDQSGSAAFQREWYMVKGIVRQAGYPCAAVAYVKQQFDGTFKVACKVKLHTQKFNAFTINPDTQSVVPI